MPTRPDFFCDFSPHAEYDIQRLLRTFETRQQAEAYWRRRFEDRGLVRGGRFVAGFSGEQYALPAAVDGLSAVRRLPRTGERVTVNACDPLNLTGVVIRTARVPAVRTNTVTYVDGVPEEMAAAPA